MSGVTGVDVEHTKALERAATDGGWAIWRDLDAGFYVVGEEGGVIPEGADHVDGEHNPVAHVYVATDAAFIVHARTAVPALVAAVERVQAQVDKTLEILDRYNHSDDGDLPECAPEDRWRLYRDLLATLNPEALETP